MNLQLKKIVIALSFVLAVDSAVAAPDVTLGAAVVTSNFMAGNGFGSNTVLGNNAASTYVFSKNNVIIGDTASSAQNGMVVIGNGATGTSATFAGGAGSGVVVGFGASTADGGTAIGTSARSVSAIGTDGFNTAVGGFTIAGGNGGNSVFGVNAAIQEFANVTNSMGLGSGSRVMAGAGGILTMNAVAIGANSLANESYTVSFGSAGVYTSRLVNVSAAIANTDAVNLGQMTTAIAAGAGTDATARAAAAAAQLTADTAVTNAATAQTTANTASANATAAQTTANLANVNAAAAVTLANTAQGTADAATVTANTAFTNANTAVTLVNALTPRVTTLETTVAGHTTAIATAQATADAATVTANNADTKATTAITTANAADTKATSALNQIGGFNNRIGGLESRMGEVETGVAGSMAMGAASSNASNAANRSAKGMGIGIGASVFAGKQATAVSYAANFGFGSVSAAASLTGKPSVQVGAGFAF